jgi:transglutaminase-like putative cysteine protease
VAILRGRRRIDALRRRDVKVLQRERELERRLYDGSSSLVLFLLDVRVGDVVETAYTVSGANPVFGGRYTGAFGLAYSVPVGRVRARLLWPASRPLSAALHGLELAPAVAPRGGGRVPLDTRRGGGRARGGRTPRRLRRVPVGAAVRVPLLGEVVDWALPLYRTAPPSPAMEERLRGWRRLPTPEARARAALRFVQDEVRYLGIELGQSSHRPHAPAEVFARRFGDCKDKSLLLVSLLRALDVEAVAALVDTEDQAAVERRLPSPAAFDHVIVRATLDGKPCWLDPTRSLERGPIPARPAPPFGRALVLAAGEAALRELPPPEPSLLDVTSTWKVERFGAPVKVTVVTRLTGERAVSMRHLLADTPRAELEKKYLDHYAHAEPGISLAKPLEVADAPDEDVVTLTETYRVPPIHGGEDLDFSAEAVANAVAEPRTALRKLPLAVEHPVHVREEVRIELPGPAAVGPERRTVTTVSARLTRSAEVKGSTVKIVFDYRSLADRAPVDKVAEHLRGLRSMRDLASFSLPMEVEAVGASGGKASRTLEAAVYGIVAAAFLGTVLVLAHASSGGGWLESLRRWRRKRAFAARFKAARRLGGDAAPRE